MSEAGKIIERIQKLLEVTEVAGATPEEAASAAAMAAKLMQKYHVKVTRKKFEEESKVTSYTFRCDIRQTWRCLDEYKVTQVLAVNGLAKLTGCSFFSVTGKINKMGVVYGLQEDIDLFMELLEKVGKHVMTSMKEHCNGNKEFEPRKLRRSFVIGYGIGFQNKINEILAKDDEVKFSDGTGLVVVKDRMVNEYLEANGVVVTSGKSKRTYSTVGAALGIAAAASAPIHKEIKG